jgi:cytidine deaminase
MSYGLTNCAERSAIFDTISQGFNYKDIKEIVIIADTEKPVSPCGACRQVMAEFLKPSTIVTMFNLNKEYLQMTINELLPYSFDKGDLDDK